MPGGFRQERGVRGNDKRIAGDIQEQIDTIRAIARQEGLSQVRLERIYKAERADSTRTVTQGEPLRERAEAAERFFGQKPRSMFPPCWNPLRYPLCPSIRHDEPWVRLQGIG